MDPQPFHDPTAPLVAWHNRHPLALRITRDDVSGVGVVVLPFLAGEETGSPSWAHRLNLAWQRVRQLATKAPPAGEPVALEAAFSEDFIPPISPQSVARFALRHGSVGPIDGAELPRREVAVGGDVAAEAVVKLYLSTASVERGRQRTRLLISNSVTPRFIGPRLWNKRRMTIAAGGLGGLVLGLVLAGWLAFTGSAHDPVATPAALAASGPVSASAASAAMPAASAASQSEGGASQAHAAGEAVVAASHPVDAASGVHSTGAASAPAERLTQAHDVASKAHPTAPDPDPVPTELPQDDIALPGKQALRPLLSADQRAEAIRQAKALRGPDTPPPVAASPGAPVGKVYALVASLTGTRSASERRQHLMALSFAAGKMSGDLHSEVMQVDKGWRATVWPFDTRAAAEAARAALDENGVYTEVISF